MLVKVRTSTHAQLHDVLRVLCNREGVSGTRSIIMLDTYFERPLNVADGF